MRKKERNQYAKHSANGFRSHGDFSYQQVNKLFNFLISFHLSLLTYFFFKLYV